jgi:hypothetical protein
MPLFSTPIVDPSALAFVTMPGTLGGGGSVVVGRSYLVLTDEAVADGARVPIVAPTDMTLTGYAYYIDPNRPNAAPQWALHYRVSCEVEIGLAHLNEVPPHVQALVVGGPTGNNGTIYLEDPIPFAEGEVLGYKVHQPEYGVDSFDFILKNSTVRNTFVNQERYMNPHQLEIVTEDCPYEYFEPTIRDAYLARMGTHGTGLIGPGTCRSVSRDVAGTLAGSWFWNEDATYDVFGAREGNYPNTIAVIEDQGQYVAIANLGPFIQQHRVFPDDATYLVPESVTDRHCYQLYLGNEGPNGYVDFDLLTPTSVRVVYSETSTCPEVFNGENGRTYYR